MGRLTREERAAQLYAAASNARSLENKRRNAIAAAERTKKVLEALGAADDSSELYLHWLRLQRAIDYLHGAGCFEAQKVNTALDALITQNNER